MNATLALCIVHYDTSLFFFLINELYQRDQDILELLEEFVQCSFRCDKTVINKSYEILLFVLNVSRYLQSALNSFTIGDVMCHKHYLIQFD